MVIDIGTVLQRFDDTYNEHTNQVNEYSIRFITGDGRLRTMRARKNVSSPKQGLRAPLQTRGKVQFNLKRNGIMMVHDLDQDEPRNVKVFSITAFKEHDQKWVNVRH